MRTLGFACAWDRPPEPTWSHTPWRLRAALAERVTVVDLPAEHPPLVGRLLWHAYRLRRAEPGAWSSGREHEVLTERRVRRRVRSADVDAVLEIGDLATVGVPYYVYQDMNRVLLREWHRRIGPEHLGYADAAREVSPGRMAREAERLGSAAGAFTMSRWQADALVSAGIVPADRAHVVGAGCSAVAAGAPRKPRKPREPRAPGKRLLYVGGDLPRKGGDLAVEALRLLRRDLPDVTLTVAGPPEWPGGGAPPEGVDFLGRVAPDVVARALREHDVFVLPTRFEAFGIAYVEALAAGLPCVGPRAFAVPELVRDGVTGVLVDEWEPAAYATAIATVLGDSRYAERAAAGADATAEWFSWPAVADRMLAAMR